MQTSNNHVLITGGSSGIGLALAKKFLATNNEVTIVGRNGAKLTAVKEKHPQLKIATADLTNRESLQQLVRQCPNINVLINNAGVQYEYQFADAATPVAQIDMELDTNSNGLFHLTKLYLPHLLQQPTAAIVNVSSALGIVPKESAPIYCASKAAVHVFTKSLRWQLEDSSVKVFEIIPPLVDTAMTNGRSANKISPEKLVAEFWQGWQKDQFEMRIGRVKQLFFLNRLAPKLAERMMRA